MSLKLVIFDVDGTLVDSQNMIVAAMAMAFAQQGQAVPARHDILAIIGLSLEQAVARLVPDMERAMVAPLADAYRLAFGTLRADPALKEPMFPSARDTVLELAARDDVLLGIATGKSMRGVEYVLAREGLEGLFATIQTADRAPSKPHPAMILQAMAETGVDAARTVMVGDTVFDMDMARAARTSAIGVGWGYHPHAALKDAGARHIVHDFASVGPALEACWSEALARVQA